MTNSIFGTGIIGAIKSPVDWAAAQVNLGTDWAQLSMGDPTANLGKAIACFEAALSVFIEQVFPRQWSMIQNNLGNAWADLPTGDMAANLRKAFTCYEAGLRVLSEQDSPRVWAKVDRKS